MEETPPPFAANGIESITLSKRRVSRWFSVEDQRSGNTRPLPPFNNAIPQIRRKKILREG